MAKTLTLITIRADGVTDERQVRPGDDQAFRQAVGGHLETVPYFTRITYKGRLHSCVAFCNEEGKLEGLPVNRPATALWLKQLPPGSEMAPFSVAGDVLVGDVAIVFGDARLMRQL
jgi:hypothetical protein